MASYVVAASLFVIGSSYLVQFIIQPPGNTTAEGEHQDTHARGVEALNVLLGTPGSPAGWTADHVDRLGLIEPGTSIRIDEAKFEALAHGRSTTQDHTNGAVDYAEAKKALGLDGYEFHLRAYPVLKAQPVPPIKAPGMTDYHVAYVGGIDPNGPTWTFAAQSEASALENVSVLFKNDTRTHAANGDVYEDSTAKIRDNLLPQLGNAFTQTVISPGSGTAYDFHRVNASAYSGLVTGVASPTSALALSSPDGQTLGYTPGREVRSVVGAMDLTGQVAGTLATLSWSEWVDTDRGNGSYDCNDHGFVEVSPDNGVTWVPLTDDSTQWSQDCAPVPHAATMSARSASITAATCAACADDSNVLVAFHWVADLDSLVGYGWVVDDLSGATGTGLPPTSTTLLHKTFEPSQYDILVIGSNADQRALDHPDIKEALRSFVNDQGGRLLVLGGPSGSAHWLDPLVGTAQGTGGGSVGASDATHPILTIPYELNYDTYTPGTTWQFTGAQTGLFTTVLGAADAPTLAVSKNGAWTGGTSNDGSVVLTSFAPVQMSQTEARMFFANMMVFGRYHSLYLELGPSVPDHTDVTSATRSATMNTLRNGTDQFGEIAFVMYVWNGTTVDASGAGAADKIPASPPRGLSAQSTSGQVWLNFTIPSTTGSGDPDHFEVWRTTDPSSWTDDIKDIPYAGWNGTFHDHNVTNGVTYYYNVTLYTDGVGRGSAATPVSTTPMDLPGAPTSVSATSRAGAIALAWTAPTSTGPDAISGYGIYSKKVGGSYAFLAVAGNSTSYSDVVSDLDERQYTIAAINGRGWGPNSTETVATHALTPATAPDLTVLNTTPHWLTLSWTLPGDLGGGTLAGYTIERSTNGGTTWSTLKDSTSSANRTWIDETTSDNTTYTYRVHAVTDFGDGLTSDPQTKATMSVPWQVTGLAKTSIVSGVSVSFSWDAPASNGGSAVTEYEIDRGDGNSFTHLVSIAAASTSYTDATAGTGNWWYEVRANNSVGSSPWSSAVQMTQLAQAPTVTVTNLTAHALAISWTEPDLGTGTAQYYEVNRSSDGGSTWTPITPHTSLTSVVNRTWIDSTVADNTTYQYSVRLVTDAGWGDPSTAVSKQSQAAPWQVKGLARTGGVNGVSTTISWSVPNAGGAPILNYNIYRGTSSGTETWYATSATTSYTDASLSTYYWYNVSANNTVGEGALSDEIHALTTPAAPTVVASNATAHHMTVTYTKGDMGGDTFSSYRIQRSTDGATWTTLKDSTSDNGTWDDATVADNTTYYYQIAIANGQGLGAYGASGAKTTKSAPWAPTGFAIANATAGQLTVTWSSPNLGGGTFSSYAIQRSTDGSSWSALGTSSSNNNTWIDLTVTANASYYYRVAITNDVGTGSYGASGVGQAQGAPWQVKNLARTGGTTGVSTIISWDVPNNGGSALLLYKIYRGSSSGGETLLTTTTSTSYTDATLSSYYYYQVSATNAVGEGTMSSEIYAKAVPAAPTVVASNATAHHLTVTYTKGDMGGDSFVSYTIQRSTDGATWTTLKTSTTDNGTWDDATVADNTTYYYQIAITSGVGTGAYGASGAKASAGVPWQVTGLARTGGTVGVSTVISWNTANTGGNALTGYNVYRSTSSGTETFLASVGSGVTTYTDASGSTYYWYKVSAVNDVGEGSLSSEIHALTTPGAPTLSISNATAHQLTLTITEGANGGGSFVNYTILRSTDNTNWNVLATDTSQSNGTWTDATASDNTTYYYKLAETTDQGTGTYSSSSSKQSIGAPWIPQTIAVTNGTANQLDITWDAFNLAGGTFSSYAIQRSTDGNSWTTLNASSNVNNASWSDKTITANSTYYYRVTVTNNAGTSSASASASKQALGAPWTVTGLARTGGVSGVSVILSWNAANTGGSAITNYDVYRDGSHYAYSTLQATTYTDVAVAGVAHDYTVRAINAVGNGAFSTTLHTS